MAPSSPRVRVLALTAVVTVVAAGAFAVLRPDGPPAPQVWRDQVAESRSAGSASSAPGQTGSASVSASATTATGGAAAAATSASGAGGPNRAGAGPAAGASTTSTAVATGGRFPAPAAGTGPTGRAPAGPSAAVKPAPAPAGPGWRLLPKAPIGGRVGHTAVWTGREMVVWGGMRDLDTDPLTDGAAFDPAARTWRKLSAAPLSPRFDAQALWTGREMIVFGGTSPDGDILADGAAWEPAPNAWRKLPASPLGARDGAVVAWAGDRLVVWGGATVPPADAPAPTSGDTPEPPGDVSEMRADGAAYVPATDRWVAVAAAPIAARSGAQSVWTGTRLVISGGYHEGDDDDRTDGAALDPVSGAWSPLAARPAAGSCGGDSPCGGVWTGTAALFPTSGLAYDPVADRWSAVAPYPSADRPLAGQPAVWTGRRLLAWGTSSPSAAGDSAAGDAAGDGDNAPPAPPTGGLYDPAANRWQTVAPGPLSGRLLHTAIWTGQEMLVWGGTAGDAGLADGAAFRPE